MAYRFSRDDVAYLDSREGRAALAATDGFELTARTHLADVAAVRARFGSRASSLVETVRLRRAAAAKFDAPQRWLFTDEALQQATPCAVADARARRLAGRRVHDVTCSIGGELDALTHTCAAVLGSDVDPVRVDMARRNVPAASLLLADALSPTSRGTVIVADPSRRAGGRRRHDPAALMPPLPALVEAYSGRDLVVKCAPGIDANALGWRGEVELVSLDGGVREACLWSEGLASPGAGRRATVLRSTGDVETYTDAMDDGIPDGGPGQWIIDPDGAVVRAGLVRHYGAAHGLWQLDPRIAYLTGDAVPRGVRGHRVVERTDYSVKELRKRLRILDCGALEILVRGVDVDPDALRRKLKPGGSRPLSLVITRIGRRAAVFICEPMVGESRVPGS